MRSTSTFRQETIIPLRLHGNWHDAFKQLSPGEERGRAGIELQRRMDWWIIAFSPESEGGGIKNWNAFHGKCALR